MRVRATQTGYYGVCLRHPGHIFSIKEEKEFSSVWMEYVDEPEESSSPGQKGKAGHKGGAKDAHAPKTTLDRNIARVDAMVEEEQRSSKGKDVI